MSDDLADRVLQWFFMEREAALEPEPEVMSRA